MTGQHQPIQKDVANDGPAPIVLNQNHADYDKPSSIK